MSKFAFIKKNWNSAQRPYCWQESATLEIFTFIDVEDQAVNEYKSVQIFVCTYMNACTCVCLWVCLLIYLWQGEMVYGYRHRYKREFQFISVIEKVYTYIYINTHSYTHAYIHMWNPITTSGKKPQIILSDLYHTHDIIFIYKWWFH